MGFIIGAVLLGLIPAFVADSKGRSFPLWWLYGTLLFIVAIVHALVLEPDPDHVRDRQHKSGKKQCPYCAEMIQAEAILCRYCGQSVARGRTQRVKAEPDRDRDLQCPDCLATNRVGSHACAECGSSLF